jgi:two-component system NtrC family sensor kinase
MHGVTSAENARILIIDDNRAIHADFRKLLAPDSSGAELDALDAELFGDGPTPAKTRYDVDCAESGETGLAMVRAAIESGRPYAVAFVDMRMPPGWDGVETIERVWQVQSDLQTVICTAFADYSWSEMIDRLGATDQLLLIKKPFDPAEIYQLASALTKKAELTRAVRCHVDELEQRVSERTRELELAQTHLLHSEKLAAVGQLASGIAHEINTPIQFIGDNIRACGDMFQDLERLIRAYRDVADDSSEQAVGAESLTGLRDLEASLDPDYIFMDAPRAFAEALEGVDRVRKIVAAMKTFAHSGGQDVLSEFNVNEALDSTITLANSEVKYVATVERDYDQLPPLLGSPGELNQVFLNLLINAAHAIADKKSGALGTITVRTRLRNDEIVISIADTGCGIPESVRHRIFEPFFTTKEVGRGSGQGLAIAHGIVVERHGGRITLDTEVGRGTTFHLHLPLHKATTANV